MNIHPGKFIVIDGTDGSGKTTQLNLLAAKLRAEGQLVEIADFPQYNTKSAGLVEEYLSGKYGSADEVDPYKASVFYAVDRYDASFKIKEWLAAGKVVLSNRYVSSNMGHQGGKFSNPLERKVFFNWLYDLEYRMFGIPKPDLTIVLHVEAEVAQILAQKRGREDWIGKTKDIHEGNLSHLKKAEKIYLEIAETFPDFKLVKCTNRGEMLKVEEINYLVSIYVKRILNLSPSFKPRGFQPISDIITKNHRLSDKINSQGEEAYKPLLDSNLKIKKLNEWLNVSNESDAPINIIVKNEADTEVDGKVDDEVDAALVPEETDALLDVKLSSFKHQVNPQNQTDTEIARRPVLWAQKIQTEAKLPTKEHHRDAGFDLYANDYYSIPPYQQALVSTGIIIKVPAGFVGLIWDKSGLANFGFKVMGGVIDSNYRDEVRIIFKNLSEDIYHIIPGQAIAKLLIQPIIDPELIEQINKL